MSPFNKSDMNVALPKKETVTSSGGLFALIYIYIPLAIDIRQRSFSEPAFGIPIKATPDIPERWTLCQRKGNGQCIRDGARWRLITLLGWWSYKTTAQ